MCTANLCSDQEGSFCEAFPRLKGAVEQVVENIKSGEHFHCLPPHEVGYGKNTGKDILQTQVLLHTFAYTPPRFQQEMVEAYEEVMEEIRGLVKLVVTGAINLSAYATLKERFAKIQTLFILIDSTRKSTDAFEKGGNGSKRKVSLKVHETNLMLAAKRQVKTLTSDRLYGLLRAIRKEGFIEFPVFEKQEEPEVKPEEPKVKQNAPPKAKPSGGPKEPKAKPSGGPKIKSPSPPKP
jgi:hypothetical protein